MPRKLNRRDFVQTATAAGVVAATTRPLFGQAPAVMPKSVRSRSSSRRRAATDQKNDEAADLRRDGVRNDHRRSDVLDALIAGVNIVELDPGRSSVGYGGFAERRGRRPARLVLHARPQEARRRRRRARGRADAVAGRASW